MRSFNEAQAIIENAKIDGSYAVLVKAKNDLAEFKAFMEDNFDLSPPEFNRIVGIDSTYLDVVCGSKFDDCYNTKKAKNV